MERLVRAFILDKSYLMLDKYEPWDEGHTIFQFPLCRSYLNFFFLQNITLFTEM